MYQRREKWQQSFSFETHTRWHGVVYKMWQRLPSHSRNRNSGARKNGGIRITERRSSQRQKLKMQCPFCKVWCVQ